MVHNSKQTSARHLYLCVGKWGLWNGTRTLQWWSARRDRIRAHLYATFERIRWEKLRHDLSSSIQSGESCSRERRVGPV